MIDGWTYYDYEQCFRRIGYYAKSIGCDVIYYENGETFSHPNSCKFLFNGTCICRIYYNVADIYEKIVQFLTGKDIVWKCYLTNMCLTIGLKD